AGFLQCFVNQVHAVIATKRDEVWAKFIGVLESSDIRLVDHRVMCGRIRSGGNDSNHLIAHCVETVIVSQIAWAKYLDPGISQTALSELFGESAGLRTGKKDESGIGMDVTDALEERCEVRIRQRNADRLDDLAAGLNEASFKGGLCFDARSPVINH